MTPGRLLLFSLILAVITSLENPVRQTFYVDMVPREDLPNAIALNSSLVSVARIAGPAIGGLVVAAYGAGVCFLLNSLSFIAVLLALLAMRIESAVRSESKDSGLQALREGLSFVRNNRTARSVLTVFGIVSFAGSPYLTLLPIVAVDVLDSGAHGFGWLMAGSGVGAIVASIAMAVRTNPSELPKLVRTGGFVWAFALVVLGLSRSFTLSWSMLFLIGIAFILVVAGTQTILHTIVLDALRGRVMSFYSLGFVGIPPFGSLVSGWLADAVGTPATLIAGGLLCLAAALYYPGARLEMEPRST
jgi:predicted MFS family arabinose efflux permease